MTTKQLAEVPKAKPHYAVVDTIVQSFPLPPKISQRKKAKKTELEDKPSSLDGHAAPFPLTEVDSDSDI